MAQGRWGVLLLSYEAAPALAPPLRTRRGGAFPLAWAAAFDRPLRRVPKGGGKYRQSPWRPGLSRAGHARVLKRLKNYIARGDIYQANFTFPLRSRWTGDPWTWYRRLAAAQGAPYSAYLDLGRWKALSLSPELFFEKRGSLLTVRPMKGSAPRGRWPEEDAALARALRASAKERAENVMIVDLLRNDLGKLAQPGSVRTTRLFHAEAYPTLWQMTSDIEARLAPGLGLADMSAALFPSGSVTGAPKRRAMEILSDLEREPRGLYTGTLGLLRPNGHWTFSVAIRTLTLDEKTGTARCPVGSGITAAARPADEYRECLLKGDFLRVPPFELLETLRLENGKWFLLGGHLKRLRRSAERLGFSWEDSRPRSLLSKEALCQSRGLWKVRLLMARDGTLRVERGPLTTGTETWKVALARKSVDERDVFLYHKTTNREVYDRFLAAHPGVDDVILWNRRGELTESTRANVVLEFKGRRYTPPVRCGLLGGVFRGDLLRRGRLRERVMTVKDLRRADRVFLVNSVRGWISVQIV